VAAEIANITASVFAKGYTTVSAREDMNIEKLCKEWFDLFVAPGLASCTEENRRRMMKIHIFSKIGSLEIKDVDTKQLQRIFNANAKAELSADYIGKMKNLLNNFFQYAVRQHYISENPMMDAVFRKCSTVTEKSGKALRPEIRENVLSAVIEDPVLIPIVFTFTLTGLRPQELIALK
jgi:site-specific recombinase XerD